MNARCAGYCARHAAIASKYAVGLCAITIKSALAAVGFLRPCSHAWAPRAESEGGGSLTFVCRFRNSFPLFPLEPILGFTPPP
jgi:hypothetical protein